MSEPIRHRRGAAAAAVPARSPQGPRHLRVVEPRPRSVVEWRGRRQMVLGAVVALVVTIVFGLVYLHVMMAQRQFALDRLNTEVSHEQSQYQRLRLQVAELEAPSRIIATAEGKLGMIDPASVTYLTQSGPAPAHTSARPGAANAAPAGDANWPQIKSLLAGSP